MIGALFGFLVMMVFSAIQSAGTFIDLFGGFQMAAAFDPMSMSSGAQFQRLYQWTALVLLFVTNGYQIVLGGLVRTFDALPLGAALNADLFMHSLTTGVGQMFVGALQIAGPLLVVLFLADVGLGLLTRVAPALNAFAMGFPLKILISLVARRVRVPRAAERGPGPDGQVRVHDARSGLMSGDSGDRTEKATAQRMKEVHRKGKLGRSQDLASWLGLGAAVLAVPMVITRGRAAALDQLAQMKHVADDPTVEGAVALLESALRSVVSTLAPLFVILMIVTVGVGMAQGGYRPQRFRLHVDHLKPDERPQEAVRHAGPVAGRQDAARSRPPSGSCCSSGSSRWCPSSWPPGSCR